MERSLVCRKGSEDGDGVMMSVMIHLRAEKAPLVVCWFEGRLGMEKGNG